MGYDKHVLSGFYCGDDCLVPEGKHSVDCCLEALGKIDNIPMFVAVMQDQHFCTFCQIWGVFDRFHRVLVVGCRKIVARSEPVPFRVFRQFRAC